jgi:hypothetical protein
VGHNKPFPLGIIEMYRLGIDDSTAMEPPTCVKTLFPLSEKGCTQNERQEEEKMLFHKSEKGKVKREK